MVSIATCVTACSFQKYIPKPIDTQANSAKFERRDPASEQFHQYLLSNGYPADRLPIQQWGLNELTYCALFFHPSLDLARAQWRTAEISELAAAEKPIPAVNSNIARSNQANQDINPFAFGLSIDIPLETANKRDIRIENARHLSEAAKLEIAQAAWQLRYQLALSLYDYQFNQQEIKVLLDEETRRKEIVAIYQKRVDLGLASNVELSTAKLQLLTTSSELESKQQNKLVLLSKLANNLGLPIAKVRAMNLAANPMPSEQIMATDIQTAALLNRLDIRIALQRYAAAESKLKLEIAKQYPDITISPGYAYEFGDRLWSLGISGLLTLLNKNKVGIAEATQLREVEAAQFEALQTKVISDTNVAQAELLQAQQVLASQQQLYAQQQQNTQRLQHRLTIGEIDRLELAFAKLESIAAEKNVALASFKRNVAINQLENTLQQPLSATQNNPDIEDLSFKKTINYEDNKK
ncbi:MAG TPA: TolC family protein [Methylotenera sp.]|nr:TolC family protein [Methylotenera sp.]